MTLNTLKDLDNEEKCGCCVNKETLKQEAIKWIKDLKRQLDGTRIGRDRAFVSGQIYWSTSFFNITEDDLK